MKVLVKNAKNIAKLYAQLIKNDYHASHGPCLIPSSLKTSKRSGDRTFRRRIYLGGLNFWIILCPKYDRLRVFSFSAIATPASSMVMESVNCFFCS